MIVNIDNFILLKVSSGKTYRNFADGLHINKFYAIVCTVIAALYAAFSRILYIIISPLALLRHEAGTRKSATLGSALTPQKFPLPKFMLNRSGFL
ncbi:MAG: hypothetical protein LBT48_07510 [Prevotellaceae bacterium]|jgi:hypothetical protein|nr:hypothetical protein [Prevotellaceae bacterium]